MGASHSAMMQLEHENKTLIKINKQLKDDLSNVNLIVVQTEQENRNIRLENAQLKKNLESLNENLIESYISNNGSNFIEDEFEKQQLKKFVKFVKDNY